MLAARVPVAKKRRLKEIAARRGVTVQALLNSFVDETISGEDGAAPVLTRVIRQLRELEPELRSRGVERLWVFGSVARGEARVDSDVDLCAEFRAATRISLTRLAAIQQRLEAALATKVDFGDRRDLLPPVGEGAKRDGVQVF
jgi:predicted nucleotidyltransferase